MTRHCTLLHLGLIPLAALAILALTRLDSTPASAFEPPELDPDRRVFVAFDQPPIPVEIAKPVLPDSLVIDTRGRVIVQVTIDSSGVVTEAEAVHSDTSAIREQAAIVAALASRFVPAKQRGVPVACRIVVPFGFPARETTPFSVEVVGRSGCVAQGDTLCAQARFIAHRGRHLWPAVDPPAGSRVSGSVSLGSHPQPLQWTSSGFASWEGRVATGDTLTISVCTRVEGCGPDSLVAFFRSAFLQSAVRASPDVALRRLPIWVEAEGCDCPASKAR